MMNVYNIVNGAQPRWERVQEIADTFFFIAKTLPNVSVDMSEGDVPNVLCAEEELCKTPACHGGWFAYFNAPEDEMKKGKVDFTTGADMIAQHLGFNAEHELEIWADRNPVIWGNEWGNNMFSVHTAFGNIKYGELTLEKIHKHWQSVAKRLRKMQEQ